MKTYYLLSLETLRLISSVNAESLEEAENDFTRRGYNIYEHRITDDISQKHPFRNIYH